MGKKIRDAEVKKVPYMIVIGEQEEKSDTISVRQHGGDNLGSLSIEAFRKIIEAEIAKKLKKF
jgi:threonyl-tRNA synthetase